MAPQPHRVPRCDTCRRRKVKCDYVFPSCGPCVKARRRCPGYAQLSTQFVSYVKVSDLEVNPGPVWRSSMYDQFLSVYLPNSPGALQDHSCMWTTQVAAHQAFGPLEAAATALGLSTVAKAHGDAQLAARGMHLYGVALSKLRTTLSTTPASPERNTDQWSNTLLTVMLFQLTELMMPSTQGWGGFLSHSSGLSSLIQASGPTIFQDPRYHKPFLFSRASIILSSVINDRQTFLASEEWQTIPWARIPKTDIQSLLDILSRLPELSLLAKNASDDNASPSTSLAQYKDKLDALTKELRDWRRDATVRDALQKHEDNSLPEEVKLNPEEIQILLFYCMTGLLIYQTSTRLNRNRSGSPMPTSERDVDRGLRKMADTIVRTVPFCLKEENGFVSVTFALLPLRTAGTFYRDHGMAKRESTCASLEKRLEARGSIVIKPNKAIEF